MPKVDVSGSLSIPFGGQQNSFLLQSLQATRGPAGHAHMATLTALMRWVGLMSAEYFLDWRRMKAKAVEKEKEVMLPVQDKVREELPVEDVQDHSPLPSVSLLQQVP